MMIKRFMKDEDDNEFLDTQDFLSSSSFKSAESEFCKIPYDSDYDDVKGPPDIEDDMDSCIKSVRLSGYVCTDGRHCKPFDPLLGETYL
ncbi:hypothetical protein Peur_015523 [Populus x canadensis]